MTLRYPVFALSNPTTFVSGTCLDRTTAYNVGIFDKLYYRTTSYNCEPTAYNSETTAYNHKRTIYNYEPTAYN